MKRGDSSRHTLLRKLTGNGSAVRVNGSAAQSSKRDLPQRQPTTVQEPAPGLRGRRCRDADAAALGARMARCVPHAGRKRGAARPGGPRPPERSSVGLWRFVAGCRSRRSHPPPAGRRYHRDPARRSHQTGRDTAFPQSHLRGPSLITGPPGASQLLGWLVASLGCSGRSISAGVALGPIRTSENVGFHELQRAATVYVCTLPEGADFEQLARGSFYIGR